METEQSELGIGQIEVSCKVYRHYGMNYVIYNEFISVTGKFDIRILYDFLFPEDNEIDNISAIEMEDDDDTQNVKIIAELTELGSGIGLDSIIAYELKSWKFDNK